ncbi:hypothetical protein [Halpernia sp.]|uniref:hypothetical protein n=1 Tax=Halpernia sp. TaxID=2782209 RepID=UPI003A8F0570
MNPNLKEKLNKYELENQIIYTGFSNFDEAENFSIAENGKLAEIAFKNGNDNPAISDEAGLVEHKNHFAAYAGPEYKFIHSGDPQFQEFASHLMEKESDLKRESPEEKYFAPGNTQMEEDPVIVLKNGEIESVTSRERAKYLKHAKVYQIGVILNN